MRGALKLFTIRNITIYVHWTFLLLVGWAVIANFMVGFSSSQLVWSVLFLWAVFLCIGLHELGHAVIASDFGINAQHIILFPIGGIASIEKLPDNPTQELAISIAGPLMNLLIAMVLSVFIPSYESFWNFRYYTGQIGAGNFLYSLYVVNIFLALFNITPAFPMDGGRILRALLGFRFNYVRATAIMAVVSKVVAWLYIVAGLLTFNPLLPFIGLFIIFFASSEEYYLRLKSLVKGIKLKETLMYDYNSLQAEMTVQEAANILVNNHSKYFIVMDGPDAVGTIDRLEVIKAIAEMKYAEPIRNLMKEDLLFFDGEADLEDVIDKLSSHDQQIYPVMENKQFSGVVSFEHIIEYLLLHKAYTKEYGRVRGLAGLL